MLSVCVCVRLLALDLTELFQNHKFVGCVDQTKALIQHQTKLYLVDLTKTSKELFYQLVLFDFSNFGLLKLSSPAPMYDIAMLALNSPESGWTSQDGPKEKLAQYIVDFIQTKTDMLKDYFSFEIKEDGCIHTLPDLLPSLPPNLDRLPLFLLRLATEVNWDDERECFKTFAVECSSFYAVQYDPFLLGSSAVAKDNATDSPQDTDPSAKSGAEELPSPGLYKQQPWRWCVEHVLFPALKSGELLPPRRMAEDGSVLQIADLHDLYKVFERC